jgi:hypothetical protein
MGLRVLKAAQEADLLNDWVWEEKLLRRISRDAFLQWIHYIAGSSVDRGAFLRRVDAFQSRAMKTKTLTLAEQLTGKTREEWLREGRQEGRLETAAHLVVQALRIRHGRVPAGLKEAVGQIQDLSKLEQLLARAIRSESVEQFAAGL